MVKPRMSENSTVISRRRPPSCASSGFVDQLLVDVLRHVSAEQPLDLPLLAILDEVAVGGAAEQRERHRQHRLRHGSATGPARNALQREPGPARRAPASVPRSAAANGRNAASRPTTTATRTTVAMPPARVAAGRMNRFGQDAVGDAGVQLDAGHRLRAERRLEHVHQARTRSARRRRSCP